VLFRSLEGGSLDAHDKYSFDLPPINSQDEWEKLVNKVFADAEHLGDMIEQFPETKLDDIFSEEKYGTYCRNFLGVIEHTHYHLGQISLIKKIVLADKPA